MPINAYPDLPSERFADVEWTNAAGVTYRFTNVARDEWVIHRQHDHGFEAHLRRSGSVYDFAVSKGSPSISALTVSFGEALSFLS